MGAEGTPLYGEIHGNLTLDPAWTYLGSLGEQQVTSAPDWGLNEGLMVIDWVLSQTLTLCLGVGWASLVTTVWLPHGPAGTDC